MPTSNVVVHALTASAAVTMLAGCSGAPQVGALPLVTLHGAESQSVDHQGFRTDRPGNPNLPLSAATIPAHLPNRSFFRPTANGKPLIFASDDSHNVVDIYLQAKGNAMVGQIVGDLYGPVGLTTDRAGNVYIANNTGGTVTIFAPPYTNFPKLTLDDAANSPADVAVSARGLVAVANFDSTVTFYRPHSTKPCVTVGDPSFGAVTHDAFDDAGNLYIDGSNGSGFTVGEIQGGCKATMMEMLSTGNAIGILAGGIRVNKHDQIAIEDVYGLAIYTYNRPTNGSLGNPIITTPLTGSACPYDFAFAASGRQLYVADCLNRAVEEYSYPAGGIAEETIPIDAQTQGVAVTPPLAP